MSGTLDPEYHRPEGMEMAGRVSGVRATRCERIEQALRSLEWAGSSVNPGGVYCLECGNWQDEGHSSTCVIGLALA